MKRTDGKTGEWSSFLKTNEGVSVKIRLLAAILLLGCVHLFAQQIWLGARVNYGLDFFNQRENDSNWINMTYNNLLLGVFADFEYARITADFSMTMGGSGTIKVAGSEDNITTIEGYAESYLTVTVLGKYAFDLGLGGIKLWPAAGLKYELVVAYDGDGDGESDVDAVDLSDLLIGGGVGADIQIGSWIFVSPSILLFYNLTPYRAASDPPPGTSVSDIRLEISIGVAFAL
jgi:hypothetical protein